MGVLHNSESKESLWKGLARCRGKMVACLFCSDHTIDKKEQPKYCCDQERKHDEFYENCSSIDGFLHIPEMNLFTFCSITFDARN